MDIYHYSSNMMWTLWRFLVFFLFFVCSLRSILNWNICVKIYNVSSNLSMMNNIHYTLVVIQHYKKGFWGLRIGSSREGTGLQQMSGQIMLIYMKFFCYILISLYLIIKQIFSRDYEKTTPQSY